MTDVSEWIGRVGTSWSEEWRRTDRSFGALTSRLLERIGPARFSRALDIGCGAGELSLSLAHAFPSADVVGVDISPELIAVACERGEGEPGLCFVEDDAATTALGADDRFDLFVSRHGGMFFADPVAAFAHLRGRAKAHARLCFSCFRSVADNGWARALGSVIEPPSAPPDPEAPGPFAFGDPERVKRILGEAGWTEVAFEPVDYAMIASDESPDREAALDDAVSYFQRIGPAARAMAEMDPSRRELAKARLRNLLADHYNDHRVTLPAAAWIVTARAP